GSEHLAAKRDQRREPRVEVVVARLVGVRDTTDAFAIDEVVLEEAPGVAGGVRRQPPLDLADDAGADDAVRRLTGRGEEVVEEPTRVVRRNEPALRIDE